MKMRVGSTALCLILFVCANAHDHHSGAFEVRSGRKTRLFCRKCGQEITTRGHHVTVTSRETDQEVMVSADDEAVQGIPPLHNMTNPHGVDFELALFKPSKGVKLSGEASDVASFFPPYKWTAISCGRCGAHLGWRFSRDGKSCAATKPVLSDSLPKQQLPQLVERLLGGRCFTLHTGWWTFQYCHKREIRQYHTEANGARGQDWSLGRWSSASANGSHHFHEGQRCDETGTGRSSEAVFKICSKGSEQAEMAMQEGEPAYIENIQEPSLCTYKFNMCILPVNEPKTFGNNATCLAPGGGLNQTLKWFDGLVWPNLVAEDADELAFVRNMKLRM